MYSVVATSEKAHFGTRSLSDRRKEGEGGAARPGKKILLVSRHTNHHGGAFSLPQVSCGGGAKSLISLRGPDVEESGTVQGPTLACSRRCTKEKKKVTRKYLIKL